MQGKEQAQQEAILNELGTPDWAKSAKTEAYKKQDTKEWN